MDVLEVLASGMTESWGGGLDQGLLQFLELCRCHESISHLAALLVTIVGALDVSLDEDDTVLCWHLQDQVGIVGNRHEHGECRPPQESVVCYVKVGNLELQVFCMEVFMSPEGYKKSDLTDGSHYYSKDYAVEWNPTGTQC
jgi:hypothetical protein